MIWLPIEQLNQTWTLRHPEIGLLGLKDIIKELEKPGLDPRKAKQVFEFEQKND
jgi:transcriptional accessory protein Tex/SPT6